MFILYHSQYLPLSFKCLSDIDNIRVQLAIEICIDQNFYQILYIYSEQEKDSVVKTLFVKLARRSHSFWKNWIYYKDFVLYLLCIQEVSIREVKRCFQEKE